MLTDKREAGQNHTVDNRLTQAERARLVELHFEQRKFERTLADLNLRAAVKVGVALKALKGGEG